jgi:1-acyl-sn-glycerol-3-phosphate acyltransferase
MSLAGALQQLILDEFPKTFGTARDGIFRRLCGSVFALPTGRFGRLFAAADREVGRAGLGSGCGRLLEGVGVRAASRGTENLPAEGPLLVVANHPGAYDSLALGSCIRRRDLKIVLREIPFFRALPNASRCFLYATFEPISSMVALREAIRHLQGGGSVLLFGTGTIEPDPELGPGAIAALARWKRSIEIIMRRVPALKLVPAAVSGVLVPAFVNHPLRLVRQKPADRRRVTEYLQVITQMLFPRWFSVTVKMSFAPPVTLEELSRESGGRLMPAILAREKRLLEEHQAAWHGGKAEACAPVPC